MASRRTYQVREVAEIARVSVRTLHHYDAIGLLVPSGRSEAGYRLYEDDDLLRLQQILIGRELGLTLEVIGRSLDDPDFDRRQALLAQRRQLERRAEQTAEMIRAVDRALAVVERPERKVDMTDIFNGFDASKYEAEAEQRWGHTEAFRESKRRTAGYSADDWKRFGVEQAAIMSDAFALASAGERPDSAAAMAVAERHRLSIDRWFYPCSFDMHRGLADLYETDARFAANMDKHGAGVTAFLSAAIRANSERAEAGGPR
jgi:MerR family transcriptional regulator, thiopeptide resistance regulator